MMILSVMWVTTHSGDFLRASSQIANHSLVQRRLPGEAGNEQALWRVSGAVEMPPALVQAARTLQWGWPEEPHSGQKGVGSPWNSDKGQASAASPRLSWPPT